MPPPYLRAGRAPDSAHIVVWIAGCLSVLMEGAELVGMGRAGSEGEMSLCQSDVPGGIHEVFLCYSVCVRWLNCSMVNVSTLRRALRETQDDCNTRYLFVFTGFSITCEKENLDDIFMRSNGY